MTFTDLLAAIIILTLFFSGAASAVKPVFEATEKSNQATLNAHETNFVIESFRMACLSGKGNFEEWKWAVAIVEELSDIEIIQCVSSSSVSVWRLSCNIRETEILVYGKGEEI